MAKPFKNGGMGGSTLTAVSVWRRMGQIAMVAEPRSESTIKMLSIRHAQPWVAEQIDFLAGTSRDETDVVKFQNEISRIQSRFAVLLTPSNFYDFKDIPLKWPSHFWVDGAHTGDLLGGCWDVFFRYKEKLGATMDLSRAIPVMTFDVAYKRVGNCCELVERLPLMRFKMEESAGYVVLQSTKHEKRLSRLPQYPQCPLTT